MEWTYCLDCGAPQFPGDAACPECSAASLPSSDDAPPSAGEAVLTWDGVLRSIWLAQLTAAVGGLLVALGVGFCLGYASRMLNRPATTRPEPPPAVAATAAPQVAMAASDPELPASGAERLPEASVEIAAVGPAAPSSSVSSPKPPEPISGFVGPPRPPAGPAAEPADDAWDLEGVRPPPEYWLSLRFRDSRTLQPRLPVYEPVSPSVMLYGRHLPGPSSVEIQWHFDTPSEWQGAMSSAPME